MRVRRFAGPRRTAYGSGCDSSSSLRFFLCTLRITTPMESTEIVLLSPARLEKAVADCR